jgi:predicted amidohydrolase
MRVTVCQLEDGRDGFEEGWDGLCRHVRDQGSELVLLPEMPFSAWFAAARPFDAGVWAAAVAGHGAWQERLAELAPATVLGTAAVERGGTRLNEAFVWSDGLARPAHHKRYLPDEDGFWEASWYAPGDGSFELAEAAGAKVGFQICTEIWTLQASRDYGLAGADIIAAPRATPAVSRDKWLVGGRAAAILAGAFCLSSNRSGTAATGLEFAGCGWIVDPDGQVLALTTDEEPVVTRDIDLEMARAAKSTYPRYVR